MGPSGLGNDLAQLSIRLDRIDGGEVLIEGGELSAMSDEQRTDHRSRRMAPCFGALLPRGKVPVMLVPVGRSAADVAPIAKEEPWSSLQSSRV